MKIVIIFTISCLLIQSSEKIVKLPYHFELRASDAEELDKHFTYSSLSISHQGKEIYRKNSLTEYQFINKQYPIVLKNSDYDYQILVEMNDRPNIDKTILFHIKNDKVVNLDTLPMFYGKAKNYDRDNNLEYAGTWDYGEEWQGKNGETVVAYSPILIYEISSGILVFDSVTTKAINIEIYGKYYGSKYNESIEIPKKNWEKKFYKELKRIEN